MLSISEPISSVVRWLPDDFSTWSVLRREVKPRLVRPFVRGVEDPISFVDRDWDTLVVLDACRYDLFAANNPFPVEAECVHANGSHTKEFLANNFAGSHPDTVYVTASPQVAAHAGEFAHVEHVWRDGWDDERDTVLPETMTDRALSVAGEYPEKRLVVHYMQPHYPFVGSTASELATQGSFLGGVRDRTYPSVWERLDAGAADPDLVWDAYAENLREAIPAVERLVGALDGKTVVTSDHGNLFGERVSALPVRLYGHPPGIHHPDLTAVPWVELPFEDRRSITAEDTTAGADGDSATAGDGCVADGGTETTRERLEALGYV
ncbi:MAG: hypothetical protein ACOCR0_02105 [Haloferacaceae archaeon]